MNLFKRLFKRWQPKLKEGSLYLCEARELEPHVGKKNITVKILPRNKNTGRHYYEVMTLDYLDHRLQPFAFCLHENWFITEVPVTNKHKDYFRNE